MRKITPAILALLLATSACATSLFDIVTKGSTDRSVTVDIIDSTDGTPETAVVFNTSGIDLWYRREGAALVSITEATLAALTTAHADGGFLHVANGTYRLDLPDAAFATGANYVDFGGTVTGMIVIGGRVRLVDHSLEDAVRGTAGTALPNAAAGASGGVLISGSNAGTTTLGALTITGATAYTGAVTMAAGLAITQSASNTAGLTVTGNGTGNGATFTSGSGATGNGISATAASTNGNGLAATGTGTGSGLIGTAGATGDGLEGIGGSTSGAGLRTAGTAGNSPAAMFVGQGSAAGLLATGGATGAGISAVGGSTSGVGLLATGSAGNSAAMSLVGQGSASGLLATGGATGHGMRLVGGSTSGNGISTSFTAPSTGAPELGFNVSGTLSGTHSSTTADLGTNAPGTVSDIVGHTLDFPTRHLSRVVTAYDTSTGVATFESIDADITLTNADPWLLYATSPSSGGGAGLDAAGVRAAIGLASANLDTQLGAIDDYIDTEVAGIKTKTDFLPSATAGSSGGVFIAGTNAATTVTTAFTSTFTGNLTGSVGSVSGAVGSVTGAVGSVTGNVGGNVTGSIGSVSTGGITATSIGADAFTAAKFASDVGTEFANSTWALDATGQQTQGSFGQAIGDPAADTDSIWALVNTNLNATVSSRASQTSVDTVDDFVDTEIATITTRLGTPSDLGGGASVAANLADIEGQTDDIGVAGAGLTAADDAVMTRLGAPVGASISADIAGVESGIAWNSAWDAEVESEATDALVAIHLDHLLAADYDPASKPGVATALLNELVENDAGVSRFTTNALEQAPTGSGESLDAIADAVWDELLSGHAVSGSTGAALSAAAAGGGLNAADVRAAIGLATANLDTQLATIDSTADAILLDTTEIGTAGAGLTAADDAVMTRLGAPAGASVSADVAAVKSDTAATLVDTAEIGVAGAGLTAVDDAVLAAIAALNNLSAAQVRDLVIEDQGGGVTLGCAMAVVLAYASGDLATTGANSTYEDPSGTETRATGTVASSGNRTATITCPSY